MVILLPLKGWQAYHLPQEIMWHTPELYQEIWNNDEGHWWDSHSYQLKEFTHFSREYMSSKLFWMGVPVTAQRAWAWSLHTAMEVCTRGFLTLWASSSMIRAHVMRSKGVEIPWKKHQWNPTTGWENVFKKIRGKQVLRTQSLSLRVHWNKH